MLTSWKQLAGIVLCYLSSFSSKAQATIDYLTPVEGYFSSYPHVHDHYSRVRDVLYPGLSEYPLVHIIGIPSLLSEYVLSIEQQKHNDPHYFLIYKQSKNNLFSTYPKKEGEQVVVDTKQVEIRPELALALADLFTTVVQQVRYPSIAPHDVFEDTTFIFVTFPQGLDVRAGQTESAAAGPTLAALLAITRRLQLLATRRPDQEVQQTLLKEVNFLRSQVR